jgi:preprotein translocase subunit SecF
MSLKIATKNSANLMKKNKITLLLVSILLMSSVYYFFVKSIKIIYDQTQGNTITYILLDGVIYDIFMEELEKGNLPNIKNFKDKSTFVESGISSFPTMTGYAF